MSAEERMAMIEEVGVGARDVGRPVLWFTVSGEGWGALQVLDLDDEKARKLIGAVHEVHDLNGRLCVISAEGFGSVKFLRLMRAPRRKP